MTDTVEHDGAMAAEALDAPDGATLLERGRAARRSRAESRTWKARFGSLMADKPAWLRRTVLVSSAMAALLVLVVAVDVASSYGRVHPRVRLGDVKVGMLTPDRVEARLGEELGPRISDPVLLVFDDESWEVSGETVGAALDIDESVGRAMAVGREGSVWDRISTRARLWVSPHSVPVALTADDDSLKAFLGEVSSEVDREPLDASVVIEGTEARLESAALGLALRAEEAEAALLDTLVSTHRELALPVDFLPVAVTDEDAKQALDDAQAMLAGPVVVTSGDRSWEFGAERIAEWIAFKTVPREDGSGVATETGQVPGLDDDAVSAGGSPDDTEDVVPGQQGVPGDSATTSVDSTSSVGIRYTLQAYISADQASETLTSAVGEAGSPPVDARFVVGGGSVTIVPSKDGVGPDIEALAVEMTRVLTGSGERVVELRTQRVQPEITTERAEQMGIRERIATFTTNFSSSNRPRVSNIHTLSDALDGTLIPPGGTFSFNDTIGPRTAAKGYQEAPAIIGGRLVPSLGGGICQVATTLFNTVFESGLPVVERRNHSFYISSYPKGRDATVSYGGIDLKFKNDTDTWILIATAYSNTSVTVSLYGTDPGYVVRGVTGDFTDVRPHGVKEIKDDTLPEGMRVVEDSGSDGRRIVVRRTVTKGGSVVREDTFTSTYQAKDETVRVGTKPAVPTATVSP